MRSLSFILALIVAIFPALALAEGSSVNAKRLYDQGVAEAKLGRYAAAALAFEAAFRERPHAASLFSAASAWEEAGNLSRAADAWAGAMATRGLSASEMERAQRSLRIIEGEVATIEVKMVPTESQQDWQAKLADGSFYRLPARLHARTGQVNLVFRDATGRVEPRFTRTLQVTDGATETVQLDMLPAALPTVSTQASTVEAPPGPAPSMRNQRILSLSLVALGLASFVGSGIEWSRAKETQKAFDQMPSWALRDQGVDQVRWTNIFMAGGATFVAAGAAVWFWPTKSGEDSGSLRPRLGLSSVGVEGRF